MENLTLRQIADAVGALGEDQINVSSVVTDSAKVQPGSVFVAIRGERFDGYDFIPKAVEAGAAAIIAERPAKAGVPVLVVNSTRKALLDLAGWYRTLFHTFVVGVTGSVGKTSTKDMICGVLSRKGKTLKTMGNFNNEIGLPRTILELDHTYQNAVIEMGMSHAGEISRLSRTAKPSVGVITNIGVSHIENLGSRENILKAKLEITDGMGPNAPLILNGDDPLLCDVCNHLERDILYYGIDSSDAEVRGTELMETNGHTAFNIRYYGKTVSAMIPVIGTHNVLNALAAFAAGLTNGMASEDIVEGLRQYEPTAMRQQILHKDGICVVVDCYNASPDSMKASLSVAAGLPGTRHFAVLGDMMELGTVSEEMHRKVGELAALNHLDGLFCLGERSALTAAAARDGGVKEVRHFLDKEELANYLRLFLQSGDQVLYKASRAMRLEEVVKAVHGLEASH